MTNYLQISEDYKTNDSNNEFSVETSCGMPLPLDRSMCMMFTGYFNGIGVEIRSLDEMALIHNMGFFGKGTASKAKPQSLKDDGNPPIIRKRQFLKRSYWYKRFAISQKNCDSDTFLKDASDLIAKIIHDTKNQSGKDVIDLISSDDDEMDTDNETNDPADFDTTDKQNLAIVVPDSDSEAENYFANLNPKCCVNKIALQEKLMLSLEEAFFLLYGLGCLQIVNNEENVIKIEDCWKLFCENNTYFEEKYVVYHYFRSKGYVVKSGIKFGGDYLLYRDGPGIKHADYIVVVSDANGSDNMVTLFGHVRMGITTVKEIMIAQVIKPMKQNLTLPKDLCEYKVRESIITGKIPLVTTNNDNNLD